MLLIDNDRTLAKGTDIVLRENEQGLMIRLKSDVFMSIAILGKAKKVLLGMEEEGTVALLRFGTDVAHTVEISYKDYCKADVRCTFGRAAALKMVDEAIESLKQVRSPRKLK